MNSSAYFRHLNILANIGITAANMHIHHPARALPCKDSRAHSFSDMGCRARLPLEIDKILLSG
jgi:hypothetical protein